MLDTLDEVAKNGVTQEEVDRIKEKLLKFRELAAAKSDRIAIELSEWAAMGDWRLYFLYRDRLEQVTPEDVGQVAQKYLTRSNRTVGMYLPTKKPEKTEVPETPELAQMIGEYQGREQISLGEAFEVSPKNIQARTTRLKLESGTEVALLSKKTRGDAVNFRLTLRYGTPESLSGLVKATEFLPSMMTRGTKKYTRQQLQDALDKQRAQLAASGSPGVATFSIETKRQNLPAVLELLEQVLREPTFPEEELGIIQRAQVAEWEKQLVDPQSLATTRVRKHMSAWPKGDPRYVPSIEEEIEATKNVTQAQLKKLHSDFLTPEHADLAIVGDFDPDEIIPLCEKVLADWKAKEPYERLAEKSPNKPGGSEEINTPDKQNAVYFSAMTFPITDTHPDYPALVLGDFILGGGSLSSRLGDRVRQQEGLSYGVGTGFNASSQDERAAFYLYAISNPTNIPKVKQVIAEELDKILKDGITDKELEEAQTGYLQKQTVARSSDSGLARLLAQNIHIGRTMEYYEKLESTIPEITPDEVREAMRKHIDPKKLYTVVAGDFAAVRDGNKK
jgi:zinc protease